MMLTFFLRSAFKIGSSFRPGAGFYSSLARQ